MEIVLTVDTGKETMAGMGWDINFLYGRITAQ